MTLQVVSELTPDQITDLLELYRNEFWSIDRTRPEVEAMLAASDVVIGLVDEDDRLVAFARVLTDFVYRATVYDVIVKPSHRQTGLGAQLMDAVIHHPQIRTIEKLALYCLPEMFPFYQRWGFTAETDNIQLMFRSRQ